MNKFNSWETRVSNFLVKSGLALNDGIYFSLNNSTDKIYLTKDSIDLSARVGEEYRSIIHTSDFSEFIEIFNIRFGTKLVNPGIDW